jgi:hypothetical protein
MKKLIFGVILMVFGVILMVFVFTHPECFWSNKMATNDNNCQLNQGVKNEK